MLRARLILVATLVIVSTGLAAVGRCESPKMPKESSGASTDIFGLPPDVVFFVDPNTGSDRSGTGVAGRPLRSLGKAMEYAKLAYARGSKTRIELAAGSYREEGFFGFDQWKPNAYLHIKAADQHTAIITGCDDWTGDGKTSKPWREEPDGVFSKRWHRDWGFEKRGIAHGPDREFDRSLIARREFVLMDQEHPLRQVLRRDEIKPGTFYVDDAQNKLYLQPPPGKHPNRNRTEVAVRPHSVPYQGWLWTIWKIQNLKIEGVVFSGAASFPNGANLHLGRQCKNVVVEACLFQHNGAGGFNFDADDPKSPDQNPGVTDVTVQNCVVRENGTYGYSGGFNNGKFVGNQFVRNNVRGDWAGYTGWSIAGAKFVLTRGCLLEGNVIADNRTGGLWFDIHCRDAIVRDCRITGNVGHRADGKTDERGVFFEISEGPLLIEHCDVSRNHIGIQIGNSRDVTIRNCKIADNLETQIGLEGRPRGDEFPPHNQNLLVYDNQVSTQTVGSFLVREIWSWGQANVQRSILGLRETTLGRNQYQHPCPSEAFMGLDLADDDPGWQPMHFNRWKRLTGQDRQGSTVNGRASLGGVGGCKLSAQQCDRSSGVTVFDGGVGDFGIQNGQADWICFEAFDFQEASNQVALTVGVPQQNSGGELELRIDSVDGPVIATMTIQSTGGWDQRQRQSQSIQPTSGIHDLFLVAKSGSAIGNVYDLIVFSKAMHPVDRPTE